MMTQNRLYADWMLRRMTALRLADDQQQLQQLAECAQNARSRELLTSADLASILEATGW